ncbi:proline-rich protein 36-like [Salvelinus sp. IW2-2015]|uniref:proline-rich protein 36-like n=1 Tax=Salvelinus sp. IW2-2015 TaxID=2691554 RepID=UPI0038D3766E
MTSEPSRAMTVQRPGVALIPGVACHFGRLPHSGVAGSCILETHPRRGLGHWAACSPLSLNPFSPSCPLLCSEPNVLDESQGLEEGNLSRVASVQSEPGQQNLLNQPPLGRNRGLRQLRRPLLSLPKSEARGPGRSGARLSTTRRSIQPKNRPLETLLDCEATHGWDQKRVVTFTEGQQAQGKSPDPGGANAHPEGRKASPAPPIAPPAAPGASSSATVKADLHSPAKKQLSMESKEKREQWGLRSSLSPRPSISRASTPTPPSSCSPLPPPPLPISRTCLPSPSADPGDPTPPPPTHLFHPVPSSHQTHREPEDEDTTALLGRNADTLLHISEGQWGTENPCSPPCSPPALARPCPPHSHALPPRRSPLPISPVDLDLDESHV